MEQLRTQDAAAHGRFKQDSGMAQAQPHAFQAIQTQHAQPQQHMYGGQHGINGHARPLNAQYSAGAAAGLVTKQAGRNSSPGSYMDSNNMNGGSGAVEGEGNNSMMGLEMRHLITAAMQAAQLSPTVGSY